MIIIVFTTVYTHVNAIQEAQSLSNVVGYYVFCTMEVFLNKLLCLRNGGVHVYIERANIILRERAI